MYIDMTRIKNTIGWIVLPVFLLFNTNTFALIDDGVWTPADLILSNGSVNFKPVKFRVDVPGGVAKVEWTNPPAEIGDAYSLETNDGVVYRLTGFLTYKAIFTNNITNLQFQITSNEGNTTLLDVPISIVFDSVPQAEFIDTTPLSLNKGEQGQLITRLTDAGRNITAIQAVMVPTGSDPEVDVIVLGEVAHSEWLGDYYGPDESYEQAFEATGRSDQDSIQVTLPFNIQNTIATASYDLYLRVTDSKGLVAYSAPRALQINGVVVDPVFSIQTPDYRIPAGQVYPITYQATHLDHLDRIEILQTGGSTTEVTETIALGDNLFDVTGTAYVAIPEIAQINDQFTVTVTLYDVNGNSTTAIANISVGDWGERTISVTNTAIADIDGSLNFANVTLTTGSALRHIDNNIKFNSLTIESGARVEATAEILTVKTDLVIDGDLQAVTGYKDTDYWEHKPSSRQHGGDWSYYLAYGDFRNPQFPGSRSSGNYAGGNLAITADNVTVNGNILADGVGTTAGGGSLSIRSSTLTLNGLISSNGYLAAAGGSVNIFTGQVTGTGSVTADGGGGASNGSGGRIAIHYTAYDDNSISLKQGMVLHAYPGLLSSGTSLAGTGTVFLKRSDQQYGELYIDNAGRTGGTTTLRSLGRHNIQNVELISGTTDQYKVSVAGYPWALPIERSWDLGIKDLFVSLNADDPSALLYQVIAMVPPGDGVSLTESRTLNPAGTQGSVQFHYITVPYDQTVEFEVTEANFGTHMYLFRDDGSLGTYDLIAIDVNSGDGLKSWMRTELAAGNYIIAIGKYNLYTSQAVTGASSIWNECNNCSYTFRARQVNTNSFVVQSDVDISSYVGNELTGVVRLDKFTAGQDTVVNTDDRLFSTIFDLVDSESIANITDLYSDTINNIGDATYSGQSNVYIGDVNANNLTLDAASLKVFGELNLLGNLTVQNSIYPDLDISRTGVIGTGGTTDSVVYEYFTVHQDAEVKITAIAADAPLTLMLFRDDGSLDTTDWVSDNGSYSSNQLVKIERNLSAGNYILALGRYYMSANEAVNGVNDVGGGNYTLTISTTESYKSSIDASGMMVGGSIQVQDTTLSLKVPTTVTVSGDLALSSSSQPTILTVPDAYFDNADITNSRIHHLNMNIAGQVTIDGNSSINLTGKGYPVQRGVGFTSLSTLRTHGSTHAGEGGVRYEYTIPSSVFGQFDAPQFPGSGGYDAEGGGIFKLTAGSLLLDGKIVADGKISSNYGSGSGGSIDINASVFNGSGRISANAGSDPDATTISVSSGGGRIKVISELNNYSSTGTYSALGGRITTTDNIFSQGAPGTIYLQADPALPGHLIVDNTRANSSQTTDRRTVLRSIGNHLITNIEALEGGDWRISVSGTPWIAPADSPDGLGLINLEVDLNASDETGTLYTIINNDTNSITVNTTDDLTPYIGNTLIGVITINQLSVQGGSYLYTDDRLVIENPTDSVIDADSRITVGQMNVAASTNFLSSGSGVIEFKTSFYTTDLTIQTGNHKFTGGLNVANNLTIGSGANIEVSILNAPIINIISGTLTALDLTSTDVTLDAGTLITERATADNLTLDNSSVLTIPESTAVRLYTLDINLTGQLNIDATSIIDLNNKGYSKDYREFIEFNKFQIWPGYYTGSANYAYGCYAGRSVSEYINASDNYRLNRYGEYEDCVYGSYLKAQYPAINGSYNSRGGGFANISANDINVNGVIRANSLYGPYGSGQNDYEGAAGGGININAATLSGAGYIEARGGEESTNAYTSFWTGSGGRISIYTTGTNTFAGVMDAGSGNATTAGAIGGAGTVYISDSGNNYRQLIVDNHDRLQSIADPAVEKVPTIIRDIGRHTIATSESLGNGLWRITIDSNELDNISESGAISTPDAITYHRFTVPVEQKIRISLSDVDYYHSMYVFIDDGVLDSADSYSSSSTQSNGMDVINTTLAAGNYIVAVGSRDITAAEVVDGVNSDNTFNTPINGGNDSTASFSYMLHVDPINGSTWRTASEHSLTGRTVSLDANDMSSASYLVVSNTAKSVTIDVQDSTLDLSAVVGNELIGVHVLDSLLVQGGAHVDFGRDRLILLQPLSSVIDASSSLTVGEIDKVTLDALLSLSNRGDIVINNAQSFDNLTLDNGLLEIKGGLTLINDLNVNTGAIFKAGSIAANNIMLDAATIESEAIVVSNNFDVVNGGVLTVPLAQKNDYDSSLNKIYALNLNVVGTLNIDALGSAINLDGKGYPQNYHGPDFTSSSPSNPEYSSHAGKRNGDYDFTYGRYEKARFAGSGDTVSGNYGGGVANILTGTLNNNGLISVNASIDSNSAGGGIHIQADTLSGNGSISANAAGYGGAGRISINVAASDTFTGYGSYIASGFNTANTGGAGTIYITSPDFQAGYLLIDNSGNISQPGSTPIRTVGRHSIFDASRIDANHVEITVSEQPNWRVTDLAYDWGLDGLYVDLDASDQAGTLYRISSNTTSSITIEDANLTDAQLLALGSQQLIGVHTFDRLLVSNGASVDFGTDRVVINYPQALDFIEAASIKAGEFNSTALDVILSNLSATTQLDLNGSQTFNSLNVTGGNVTVNGDLSITTDMVLSDVATYQVTGNINVVGDLSLAGSAQLSSPNIQATNLLIDGATVETETLNVINNVTILSSTTPGVLTTLNADYDSRKIYELNITAGNGVYIYDNASIDVRSKGYPGGVLIDNITYNNIGGPDFNYQNSVGCHAGIASYIASGINCVTYGYLEEAKFAGSASYIASSYSVGPNGGGIIRITAPTLDNNGYINADGTDETYYASAGGSINIDVDNLLGNGFITANGGRTNYSNASYISGGGGRISLYLPDSLANGFDMANVQAKGGAYSTLYNIAGSGTVYLKYDNETDGHLVVDNGGNNAALYSTPIRSVGRHVIQRVTDLGGDNYELYVGTNNSVHQKFSGSVTSTGTGSIAQHTFALNESRNVTIEITRSDFDSQIYLLEDTGTSLVYINTDRDSGNGFYSRIKDVQLSAGNYVVAVGADYYGSSDAISGTRSYATDKYGFYTLKVDTDRNVDTWSASDPVNGWGLDGLQVTLDPADLSSALYTIVSNTEESITVSSPGLDLTTVITPGISELLGVRHLETLNIGAGAHIDFGGDRIIVNDTINSFIDSGSSDVTSTADADSVFP